MFKLGDEAVFDCDPRYRNYTIPAVYASSHLLGKYKTWYQLDKKRVLVCQIVNTVANTVKVFLKDEGPLYTFVIDGQHLTKVMPAPVASGCTCSTQTLMIRGCACGHFKKETRQVTEITPW